MARRASPYQSLGNRGSQTLSDRLKTAVRVLADHWSDAAASCSMTETTDTLALREAVGLNPAAVGVLTLHPE